jgi:hypothetical protein
VGDGLAHVTVEALLAVVAVAASCVVTAVEADTPTLAPRQLVELHVESAAPGMQVAVTGCREARRGCQCKVLGGFGRGGAPRGPRHYPQHLLGLRLWTMGGSLVLRELSHSSPFVPINTD